MFPAVQTLTDGRYREHLRHELRSGRGLSACGRKRLGEWSDPTNFLGICVKVGGRECADLWASSTQVNFQVPVLDATGSATVQVIGGCGTTNQLPSNVVTVGTQTASPEFFYFVQNTNGVNPVAATDAITAVGIAAANLFPGSGFAPAHPNEYVTIYGTGFGATAQPVAPGAFATALSQVSAQVTVLLNGVALLQQMSSMQG